MRLVDAPDQPGPALPESADPDGPRSTPLSSEPAPIEVVLPDGCQVPVGSRKSIFGVRQIPGHSQTALSTAQEMTAGSQFVMGTPSMGSPSGSRTEMRVTDAGGAGNLAQKTFLPGPKEPNGFRLVQKQCPSLPMMTGYLRLFM